MRKLQIFLFVLFQISLYGQKIDTLATMQVDSLIQVSRGFTGQKQYDKALEASVFAETIALEKCGRVSAEYGSTCFNHGRILYFKRDYPEAEKWYKASLDIREKVLGKAHLDYAWSLNNLANLYLDISEYSKAESLYLEARTIRANALGREHVDYLNTTNNLAIVYDEMGKYELSEALYLEIIEIRARKSGKNHPDYALSINNLGLVYMREGLNEKALALLGEAKEIREKALGKEHPDFASSLSNLSQLFKEMGDYEKAELNCLQAKNIREKTLGKDNPRYAWSLNNLASLYAAMGIYEKAEPLFIEALDLKAKLLGKENPDYAQSISNLSMLYELMGKYDQAEALARESRGIRERTLGKDHRAYLSSTMNLANIYVATGRYQEAQMLFSEALSYEKTLATDQRLYASLLSNSANLYLYTKDYQKAEELLLQAKQIQQQLLGAAHPEYKENLESLARLYWLEGKWDKAGATMLETDKIGQKLLAKGARHLSERELTAYIQKYAGEISRDFSFAQTHPELSEACYNDVLFEKGFLLNAVAQMRKANTANTAQAEKFQLFKSYEHRLAAEYTKPLSEQINVAELEDKANALEKELTQVVAGFGEAIRQVTWQEVQQKLQPGEASIEFVHYHYITPNPTDSVMYAALILTPNMNAPAFIPLFEEKQLKSLLQTSDKPVDNFINSLYASGDNALYTLFWKPLEPVLNKAQTVYFSASGLLHRFNMSAVAVSAKERLADRYHLVEISSTRQLVIPASINISANNALLYGSIQYDMDSVAIRSAEKEFQSTAVVTRGGLNFTTTDSTLRGGQWNYLKWTEVEVNATETLLADAGWEPFIRKGYEATEASLKAIGLHSASPRVLHLATHGFFFPDPSNSVQKPNNAIQEPVFKISESPMIRSGLILAGGNYAWKHGKPFRPDMEDGILTAYEISQMNLRNTELVVLSACETGLGDLQGNEGVYGLQRAFKIAGARYLIMSLWQVPDFQTQELMITFYSRWIEDKMTVPQAFQSAQKAMREKYKDPFLWAGFVLVE